MRPIVSWFLSIFFLAAPKIPLALASSKVVDLGYAKYESDLSPLDGVTSFLGIRYAAPPIGHLRFRAPQPPANVSEIQSAMTPPNQCFQASITGSAGLSTTSPFRVHSLNKRDVGFVDEDCLFLNVHVPSSPKSKLPLPVIVYIHGGGYDAGNVSVYPVEDFVQGSNGGLVAVSIQYRLGLFGFLSGQEVKNRGSLNVGLLDQAFALQWVQRHISRFGGDHTKVTIWGQSAGAGSVLQHIVANGGSTQPPLFRAALMNSPFLPFQYHYNDPIPEKLYSEVVAHVNCTHEKDTLQCLRSAPASSLLAADTDIGQSNFMGVYTFVPVVDETIIVERPTVTLQRGRVNGKALLVSTNPKEGLIFTTPNVLIANNFTLAEYVTQLFPRLNKAQIQTAVSLYSNIGFVTVPDQASAVMGDAIFVCPAYDTVSVFGEHGRKAEFAIPPGTHATDLSYDLPTFAIPATFNNTPFIKAWEQSFLSTAVFLDANHHFDPANITPEWPSWSNGHTEMLFNKTDNNQPVVHTFQTDAKLLKRCDFWRSVAEANSQ